VRGGFCGTLSDRAPEVSRLFFDVDVNKKDCDVEISDDDIITFSRKFNIVMSKHVRSKKGFFDYPDPTPQIHVDGSNFQWYTHPRAEMELEDLGHAPSSTERIELIKQWIDPATIIILKSRLVPREVSTYHLIFPFLIGIRKTYLGIMRRLKDMEDSLWNEIISPIGMDHHLKKDAIIKSIDLQVLQNGAMRGYLQDKWDCGAYCPAERPFVFLNMISHGEVYPINFFGTDKIQVVKRIWNASAVCLDPNFICLNPPQSRVQSNMYGIPMDLTRHVIIPDVRPM